MHKVEYCAAFEINKAALYVPIWHNFQDHVGKQGEKKKSMCKRMYIVCFVCMYLHRISLQKKPTHNKFNNGSFVEELGV